MLLTYRRSLLGFALLFTVAAAADSRRIRRGSRSVERLAQEATLSPAELGHWWRRSTAPWREDLPREGQGETTRALDAEQQIVVFGMLSDPVGMFDEGVRQAERPELPRAQRARPLVQRRDRSHQTLVDRRRDPAARPVSVQLRLPEPRDYTLELIAEKGRSRFCNPAIRTVW